MAYVISEDCIFCGACIDTCPIDAISEGEERPVIDQSVCIECGACVASCPMEAIEES